MLGGFIGNAEGANDYVNDLVTNWIHQIKMLSTIAKSEPHAAYAGFVTGFQHKLNYFMRVIPNLCNLLTLLDEVLDTEFIPALTDGHICSKEERLLLSLPSKQGGLALPIFSVRAKSEYENSRKVCDQHISNIKLQQIEYSFDMEKFQRSRER